MDAFAPPIKRIGPRKTDHWSDRDCVDVFFAFCNMRCPWCNVGDLVLDAAKLETMPIDAVYSQLSGCSGLEAVCATGGEPTMHRGLSGFLRGLKDLGFLTCVETNGAQPHVLKYLLDQSLVDHILLDIKAPLEDAPYSRAVGVDVPASLIVESLDALKANPMSASFRTTVVPGIHNENDVTAIALSLRGMGFSSLSLNRFDPSRLLDPELEKIMPYSDNAMLRMQTAVNAVFT